MSNNQSYNTQTREMKKNNLKHAAFMEVDFMGDVFKTSGELNLNDLIENHIKSGNPKTLFLAHYNLNSLSNSLSNEEFKSYYSGIEYAWIDGMPIIFMLKILGYKVPTTWRLTFLDWQHSFFFMANKQQWRIFILGTTEELNNSFITIMEQKYPDIKFEGHHGFLKKNDDVTNEIKTFSPDVLLVGMGMPKQEVWINRNKDKLNSKVVMPLGGYFDYIAGDTYTPPRLSGKLGLEWLFRLLADPKRLAYRYLVEPWPVLFIFLKALYKKT